MDRFEIEPQNLYRYCSRALIDQGPRSIEDMNVSELEVFMLRGRRLQARAMGEGFGQLFGKLRRWLHGSGHEPTPRHPDCHSAAQASADGTRSPSPREGTGGVAAG